VKGEVAVRAVPVSRAWAYPQIPALEPGESVLYRWGGFGEGIRDPLHTVRAVASRWRKLRNIPLSVHKTDEGILVVRRAPG
jgi:hypothetical protein